MFLTLVSLGLFGIVSGTNEGKMVYRTMGKAFVDMSRGIWERRKERRAGAAAAGSGDVDIELN